MDIPLMVNHVFVDFENVQDIDLSVIGQKAVSFTLLVGAKQTKLDASLVEKLLLHANSVQLVRLTTSGKNALDFALAYYVGRSVSADPASFFHIVSKDTGYDALIEHLRRNNVCEHRHPSLAHLSFSGPVKNVVPAPLVPVAPSVNQNPREFPSSRAHRSCPGVFEEKC